MQLYFDTSALVKRYDPSEPGAAVVIALCERRAEHNLYTSELAGPETASVLRRKEREGRLNADEVKRAWAAYQGHARSQYILLAVHSDLVRHGERLILNHQLRAFDALHLASALAVHAILGEAERIEFVTADREQAEAASQVGLGVRFL